MPEQTYTYRAGQKILLDKAEDQFIVRALPEELEEMGIDDAEQVSSASSRVTTRVPDLERIMSESRHVAPTHHAYYVADTEEEFLISDRIFVTFVQPPSQEQLAEFMGRYALLLMEVYGDRDYLFQLTDHTGMNPVKLVVKLTEEEPLVESAEHDLNHRATVEQLALPTDPSYVREWHLHTQFVDPDYDPRSCTRCEEAWQLLGHFGSQDVVIGVTDDGCKLDHPDFDSAGKFAGWGYFRGEQLISSGDIGADPAEMYVPGANHGTSCAGVIAGEVDAALAVGAAPGCRLLPIQWESSGPSLFISDSRLRKALDFVADKVDVLSNSWGGVPTNLWPSVVTNRIKQLAQSGGRRGRGILFLWAAGNENCPIAHAAEVDVPYTDGWQRRPDGSRVWIGVQTARSFRNNLVGIPGVLHIAALASTAQRSHYSNYGTGLALCAPTNNVHKYRRLTVRGLGITTATGEGTFITESFGGTSSATPLVAGIAALIISANPELSALEVADILRQTAAKDLSLTAYPPTPPASFDLQPTWDISPVSPFDHGDFTDNGDVNGTWSPWFGHGRADARAGVEEALRRRDQQGPALFQQAAEPASAIPDNSPTGVRSVIQCPVAAAVTSIQVGVDITHTYIGDLRVTLTAPSATAIELHNRNGGSADNLIRTYDITSAPALHRLVGQPTQGAWELLVQDLARADSGKFNRWELQLGGSTTAMVTAEEAPGIAIPDNNPAGILRTLDVSEAGVLQTIEIDLDITHTYIGDLVVTLTSPGGTAVTLHQRMGGSTDNLIRSYDSTSHSGLQVLQGQSIQGAWVLKVADHEAVDTGKLNRWALRLRRA